MPFGNDHSTVLCDYRFLVGGLVYAITCIVCILVLVQRIRRRQRRRRWLLEGQMDSSFEKSGGEESSGATSAGVASPTTHDPYYVRASLPSACDILQPLSHSSPLPPSGYLAAVLGQERRNRIEHSSGQENLNIRLSGSPRPSSDDDSSVASPTDRSRGNRPSGIESSPTLADHSSQATSPPIERGAEGDDQGIPGSPGSSEPGSIRKRSQQVQFLHDVDDEGVRIWRRLVIEYS
ncbi:hypothetical protein BJX63DRAFT_426884 [Aspergillus granulosus]|uniref:Uncharacterized protein n=1 Tax=Aspergillus granulosus TaxID=176169 RepID=A0ABR4I852_9EURO